MDFAASGAFGKCLETFLVVIIWEGSASGVYQVEARAATKHSIGVRDSPPQHMITWPQMSIVLRLRYPALAEEVYFE